MWEIYTLVRNVLRLGQNAACNWLLLCSFLPQEKSSSEWQWIKRSRVAGYPLGVTHWGRCVWKQRHTRSPVKLDVPLMCSNCLWKWDFKILSWMRYWCICSLQSVSLQTWYVRGYYLTVSALWMEQVCSPPCLRMLQWSLLPFTV